MKRLLCLAGLSLATFAQTAEKPPIVGLWLMGQSLCDGSESLPLVTPKDTGLGNYSFKRGVRTWLPKETPEQRPDEQFTLVPLTAQANCSLGETVANGLADHLSAKQPGSRHLVACAGQGGRQIQELSKADLSNDPRTPESRRHGGGYYRTSLDDARRAMQQAKMMGTTFRIGALYWMQGEGNGGPTGGIMPTRWDAELPRKEGLAWYRDQLIAYRQQWSADLCAITGQSGELPMFVYQTLGPAGDAQLLAADADPHLHMVGPHYAVPSAINSLYPPARHGDPIHLSADGERWWGEQVGKVMHRVLHKDEKWQPLRPKSAKLEATRDSVMIEFIVPRPPLVLDTTFLPRQESAVEGGFSSLAGFRVHGTTLKAVEIATPTSVRLQFVKPLPMGETCRVSYGYPFAAALGSIAAIRDEALVLERSFAKELKPLTDEGAFFVASANTRGPVRSVTEENGVSVLHYETRELRNKVAFAIGQDIVAQRSFSYGNLRDSDPEPSTHRFADARYGTRAGQPYPLWNWCILFSDLQVD